MATYRVTWSIDVEADSLLEAAGKARLIQLDAGSTATVFDVEPHESGWKDERVDLSEPTLAQKEAWLASYGYRVEPRDPEVTPEFPGSLMIVDKQSPEWFHIVGDSREALIEEAFEHLLPIIDEELPVHA